MTICEDFDEDDVTFTAGERSDSAWRKRLEASLEAPIKIVSADEAEKSDFVVCALRDALPKIFDDDVYTTCADCGIAIRHRPHTPKTPKKICAQCAGINILLYRNRQK